MSLRWRIAIPYVLLLILAFGGLGLYLSQFTGRVVIDHQTANLLAEASILAEQYAPALEQGQAGDALNAQVRRTAGLLDARVTIILPDGRVIAESHDDPGAMENHMDRPEVQAALNGEPGQSIRRSDTLGQEMLYVAVPIRSGGSQAGVLRLAVSLSAVQADLAELRNTVLAVTAVTALLAILLAVLIAQRTIRPLTDLATRLTELGDGSYRQPPKPLHQDEVALLSQSFGQMAHRLSQQVEQFKAEQVKLEGLLTYMTDGILIVDVDGRVLLINAAAQRLFNISAGEALGQTLVTVVRQHELVDLWQRSLRMGDQQSVTLETTPQRTFVQGIASPLSQFMPGSTLLVFQDLTRLHRLETVRRDFVSNVSHELRTPLASLKMLAETLQDGALEDPPAARHFLGRMEEEIDNLTQLVRELLELSRIESGRVPLHQVDAAPEDLLGSGVERMQVQAQRAGLTLRFEAPADLPPVHVDPERLEQVLVNLIHNAIKFTQPGGEIVVSAQAAGEWVEFRVRDTGAGIPPEALSRIFERFYKADRSRSGGGTGLGLSIARHMVELHGGRIWAESVEGEGSTFIFSIPAARQKA